MARWKLAGAFTLLLAGTGLALVGQPSPSDKVAAREAEIRKVLESRSVHIDPGELLALVRDNRRPFLLLDVRREADFNAFHLLDSERVPLADFESPRGRVFSPEAVKVLISNDERDAERAWSFLYVEGIPNIYVLAGGINLWLEVYRDGKVEARPAAGGDETLRHAFPLALGDRYPEARPEAGKAPARVFEGRIRSSLPARKTGAGCGG